MTPYKTYHANKHRLDLRKYTLEMSLQTWEKQEMQEGKVYIVRYLPKAEFPTDKHHLLSVVFCFGASEDKTKFSCVNFLYMKPYISLRLLEWWHQITHREKRPVVLDGWRMRFHAELETSPYNYTLKTFRSDQILASIEIPNEDWGMIPLLKPELMGIANTRGIKHAFDAEFNVRETYIRKKKAEEVKKIGERHLSLADRLAEQEREALEFFVDLNSDEEEGKLSRYIEYED